VLLKALDNEKELLSRIANGDQHSYKIIFEHYWDQIYSTAFVFTKSADISEDLAQDVFAQIWIKKESLAAIQNFESFLYIMARNIAFDKLRKQVFTKKHSQYLKTYFEESLPQPEHQLEFKELEQVITNVIDQLPPQQRTAFRLSRFHGMSHEEIAKQMGISKQSVKSYIVRAIVTLKKFLAEHPDQYLLAVWVLLFLKKNY
jgi:RNA polymerase sigma-70 factor (ECF subfamily)